MKTLSQLIKMKDEQTKISMVTAYDFPSAKQAEQARIDMILVGDSRNDRIRIRKYSSSDR